MLVSALVVSMVMLQSLPGKRGYSPTQLAHGWHNKSTVRPPAVAAAMTTAPQSVCKVLPASTQLH